MIDIKLTHPTYKFVEESQADAIAYAFLDKNTMKKLPFKFPELEVDEIRAKVTYSGLCFTDHHYVSGESFPCKFPFCPGHEIVGVITHLGSAVKDFSIGDKVGFGTHRDYCGKCEMCQKGHDQLCQNKSIDLYTYGDKHFGGYATSIQHPAKCFFKLPEELPESKIPPLFCAGITVYNPLVKYSKAGQEVAVLGIGGLGHLAVKYAKALGYKVTAFTSSLDKEKFIKELGADRVLVTNPETLQQEAGKYDLIINTLPSMDNFVLYVYLTKPLGVFCQVGAPGLNVAGFNPIHLLFGNITLVGSNTGSTKDIKEMLEFSAKNNIVPLCEEFDFEDFPKAYDRLVNGKPIFRCVANLTKAGPKKN